jgi:hypothetical protein
MRKPIIFLDENILSWMVDNTAKASKKFDLNVESKALENLMELHQKKRIILYYNREGLVRNTLLNKCDPQLISKISKMLKGKASSHTLLIFDPEDYNTVKDFLFNSGEKQTDIYLIVDWTLGIKVNYIVTLDVSLINRWSNIKNKVRKNRSIEKIVTFYNPNFFSLIIDKPSAVRDEVNKTLNLS